MSVTVPKGDWIVATRIPDGAAESGQIARSEIVALYVPKTRRLAWTKDGGWRTFDQFVKP